MKAREGAAATAGGMGGSYTARVARRGRERGHGGWCGSSGLRQASGRPRRPRREGRPRRPRREGRPRRSARKETTAARGSDRRRPSSDRRNQICGVLRCARGEEAVAALRMRGRRALRARGREGSGRTIHHGLTK
ncbi:hypothetical protein ABZP36_026851 [Zizania latifolia]